ncbi:Diphthine synthase [Strongyloides ratti]|uniref:diphthine methyl ester synthase n=1 Tax=Strongyloides ratti TaxID=34506 RepID=A0A090L811_STRRB|nr:Diphthine synthase [Strongyloides ratti]CEF64228.1 Diphthine synthase [Strongyloides ratti]
MVFYLIGLGLGTVEDITVKGQKIIKECDEVFLESYTSILSSGLSPDILEKFYDKKIIPADREMVESFSERILENAKEKNVALLVVGDPFGATTHSDIYLRAVQMGITVKVIHNASIMNAIGCTGLQLYNFGETVSFCFWTDTCKPISYFEKVLLNLERGQHTLCLLDIKTNEINIEELMKGRMKRNPPQYMTASEAAQQILVAIDLLNERNSEKLLTPDTMIVAVARLGWDNQKIVYCSVKDLVDIDMGPPLHSVIIPSPSCHPMEYEMLNLFRHKKE